MAGCVEKSLRRRQYKALTTKLSRIYSAVATATVYRHL